MIKLGLWAWCRHNIPWSSSIRIRLLREGATMPSFALSFPCTHRNGLLFWHYFSLLIPLSSFLVTKKNETDKKKKKQERKKNEPNQSARFISAISQSARVCSVGHWDRTKVYRGYLLGKYPTEVFDKIRYGLNNVPSTPVWFGTNLLPEPDTSVSKCGMPTTNTPGYTLPNTPPLK